MPESILVINKDWTGRLTTMGQRGSFELTDIFLYDCVVITQFNICLNTNKPELIKKKKKKIPVPELRNSGPYPCLTKCSTAELPPQP